VQYVNQKYWNTKDGGIGTKETGRQLNLSYMVPISGSELENFNTMIGTGEYPEIVDLAYSIESPHALYENGVLMDITEYVERYMPNYMAFLDANPELKPLVQVADDDGSARYYALYSFADGAQDPWEGTCYRRDLVVKYATPTEYVWDWESEYVKENGHPAVTPLDKAMEEENLEGWKKNDVTEFEASEGTDPANDYTDNVIFPSGTSDPITISDWEWMFEAFDKAFAERGWAEDVGAYGFSIMYTRTSGLGDITSSFGGGTGGTYLKDGVVYFDGTSDNFKAYVECMRTWYEKGWLDSNFYTRASDMFYQIDTAGVNQGKVGMWCGLSSTLGSAIRVSCQDPSDQKDAYVMGAALPINDVYGGVEQMYKEPDSLYQGSRKGSAVGITNKAEDKDLATLFTFLDWTYTEEGAKALRIGLNAEQYANVELDPDLYEAYDIETAYTESVDEEGKTVISTTFSSSDTISIAIMGQRMAVGLVMTGNNGGYTIDKGLPMVNAKAKAQWAKFLNTGNITDYMDLLNPEEAEQYNKSALAIQEYSSQNLPNVIKGELGWEEYAKGFETMDTETMISYFQKYVDLANAAK